MDKLEKAALYGSAFVIGATLGLTLMTVLETRKDVLLVMAIQNEIAKKTLDLS